MNALNLALTALDRALTDIAARDDLRAVVITGAGPAFCAGADLKEVLAGQNLPAGEPDFLDRASDVFNALRACPKSTIAALNGTTMAGGLELAMACDLIVAAESAQLADAHANYGVYPGGGGAAVLPRRIPLNMAMYLLYTGKALTATEMKTYGLVCEVHPDDTLADAALALAQRIAEEIPVALRRMKEVARATAAELIAHVKSKVGGYKAPKALTFVESLPLTAVGKVLRRVVKEKYWAGRERRIS